jgi:hypothetical protein
VGTLISASRARLSKRDPPDGYLEFKDSGIIPVEVTERLQEGRRRGDEDHSATKVQRQDELDAAIDQNSEWLEALIRKKLAGDHNCFPRTVLLVYHNTSLYNFDPTRTRAELEAASQLRGNNIVGSMILYEGESTDAVPSREGSPDLSQELMDFGGEAHGFWTGSARILDAVWCPDFVVWRGARSARSSGRCDDRCWVRE